MTDIVLAKFREQVEDFGDKIEIIYLFGSRARGDEKPNSDFIRNIFKEGIKIE